MNKSEKKKKLMIHLIKKWKGKFVNLKKLQERKHRRKEKDIEM